MSVVFDDPVIVAGNQNRTPLQASDNRKKISFRWNSRSFPAGSLFVASKSAERQLTVSTDSSKLVPYEDDVSDDSDAEKLATETIENMHVVTPHVNTDVEHCTDSSENTASLTAIFPTNGQTDHVVSPDHTEKLHRLAQPTEMSENTHMPDCSGDSLLSSDNNCGTNNVPESSSDSLSVQKLESVEKGAAALLRGITERGLTAVINGEVDHETVQTQSAANHDSDMCQVNRVKNDRPSHDSDAICHSVAGRKRHARHKSRQHRSKHQHRRINHSSASAVSSSDEEVEYVWVEKTVETLAAQQHGGRFHVSSLLFSHEHKHNVNMLVSPLYHSELTLV